MEAEKQKNPSKTNVFARVYNDNANVVVKEPKRGFWRILSNIIWFGVAFAIPIVGFIAYVLKNDEHPKDARYPLIGCIIGFIVMFTIAFMPLIQSIVSIM